MDTSLPKGMFDIIPTPHQEEERWKSSHLWHYVEGVMQKVAHDYGYLELRTPILEKTDLFIRGVGETSDIVSKEMYTFKDKGDRLLTMRPEGTAPAMRAFIENSFSQSGTLHKLFYIGPFFRYDRPQKGRFRQFHQFGVEAIGESCPQQDLEVIDLLLELYRRLGLKDLHLMINSVGSVHTRKCYKEKLLDFLRPHFPTLTPESQERFTKNPLRILDSKDPKEQNLLAASPLITDCLDEESKHHFDSLCTLLNKQKIAYEINPKLVRGLDYYNHTVFEVVSDVLGAQNTIGGGGRYDGLLATLGGENLPSVGFSTGVERILQTMLGQKLPLPSPPRPFLFFIPLGEKGEEKCLELLYLFRHKQIPSEISFQKKIQKALQRASALSSSYALLLGDEELAKGKIQCKALDTRESKEVPLSSLLETIEALWKKQGW
ncbi:MAG: histidine--tRNA ligase [Simkania negevensis]|nr:histidine--tRNA ligase [Simkania negevensis]